MRRSHSNVTHHLSTGLLIFLLALFLSGCGGGTYGTGGSHSTAILRSATGTPIEGAIVQGVGSSKSYTSKRNGSVYLPLNQSFPLSPIRITLMQGEVIYRYVNTDEAIATKSPIILEFDEREGATVEAKPATDACIPQIDSWKAGISDDAAGLSSNQQNAITLIIDSAQLQCEEKLQLIVAIAFP